MRFYDQNQLPLAPIVKMTDKQMFALEEFINRSRDATPFARRAILYAMRQSKNLTKRVSLSVKGNGPEATELMNGASRMNSSGCGTRVDLFFQGMGTEFGLSELHGLYAKPGVFDNSMNGTTIWLSPFMYDHGAQSFDHAKLLAEMELPPVPGINCEEARHLFKTLQDRNDINPASLEELEVHLKNCRPCGSWMAISEAR